MARKLLLLLVSSLVAGALGWLAFRALRPAGAGGGTRFVDTVDEFAEILESRVRPGEAGAGADGSDRLLVLEEDRDAILSFLKPRGNRFESDRLVYYKLAPNFYREQPFAEHPDGAYVIATNSLGLRNREEVRAEHPDLRVLVAGDSHTYGLCSNEETFVALLEGELAARRPGETVETLNAGVDSHHHYMYVGALEKYGSELAPDVFVAVVFGGNDFAGALKFQRYFRRRPMYERGPATPELLAGRGVVEQGFLDQEIQQLCYFLNNPGEEQEMAALGRAVAREIARLGEGCGSRVVFVYLPPPSRGQPERYAADVARVAAAFGVAPEELASSDRLADEWLAFLDESGLARLDLRPAFRASAERLYWKEGHINLAGHRVVARELAARIDALLAR